MSSWQFDALRYGNTPMRVMGPECRDARITAMWIDAQSSVPMSTPYANVEWDQNVLVYPWQTGDVRDTHERDLLPGTGEPLPYAPIGRMQWHTDYPGDAHREQPQGLSLLAAAIVAARRAAGVADTPNG
jgi:hypothetical protein